MSRLSICAAITWMAVFWPMAYLLADGPSSASGPSGPVSLHFKRPADGGLLARADIRQRIVLDTTRLYSPAD